MITFEKYDNKFKLLFTETDTLMYEIKTKEFNNNKEMFVFGNYSTKSKYYDNSKKLVIGKMKDKTGRVAIKEFVGLRPKMHSFLVVNNSEHEKLKCVNRNVVPKMSHTEYKDILFYCL